MNAIELLRQYHNAWNDHDAEAIVALFAEGATYNNPATGQDLTGEAIATFAKAVWAAFPDVSWDLISIGDNGAGLVARQWLMRGTNTGPGLDGTPPTGRTLALPGASFNQVEGDKIRWERDYFDRKTQEEQLGGTAT